MKIPVRPPDTADIIAGILKGPEGPKKMSQILMSEIGATIKGRYRHWDTLRHIAPGDGLSAEERWLATKLARRQLYQTLPLRDTGAKRFVFALPSPAHEMLHRVDRDASGSIQASDQVTNPHTRDSYLIKSLFEEAITSSQLEGASTTRQAAKDMLQTGREPIDRSERMILNNYRAMQFMRDRGRDELTPGIVLELQRILTEGTLDEPDAAGRFRRADEPIVVGDETGQVLHRPPAASTLAKRMAAMCAFANERESDPFVHPVVRAIVLHFWLAYDHPFVDGNGRTARALFYWSMARSGYWLCEFISISRILRQAKMKYARSYLYCETDENDVTYFLLQQLDVILRAVQDLHSYLRRKQEELTATQLRFRQNMTLRHELNHRQLALLNHALKKPEAVYTVESHRRSHDVVYETARSDLLDLVRYGLLEQRRGGRAFTYHPAPGLGERLAPRPG